MLKYLVRRKMMKKLIVLALVVSMASLASAALTWSSNTVEIEVGSSATLQLSNDSDLPYAGGPAWVGADPSTVAAISGISALSNAGPDAVGETTAYAGWWTVAADDKDLTTWDVVAGAQWDVTIAGLEVGEYVITSDSYGSAGAGELLTISVVAVPEPMTMALLGLGGLFLRRRK
jgi:hypothetical protein